MENSLPPIERFHALERFPHGFVRRVPGVELSNDKTVMLANLDQVHHNARRELGLECRAFVTARQVHGNAIAVVDSPLIEGRCFENCDGVVTNQRSICLGIFVADCCAVFLVDRRQRAIGLVHSGKKGSALGIVTNAIRALHEKFAVAAADLVAQLSPCIRPPHYEVDFAAQVVQQCRDAGVEEVHDSGVCTACDLKHYYSYRAEKGRTGRMLALLAL